MKIFENFRKKKIIGITMTMMSMLIILSWFTVRNFNSNNNKINIEKGRLILEEGSLEDGSILNLAGEWEFYWEQLLSVESFLEGAPENQMNAQVPLVWNQYTLNNQHLPGFGFGTYRLHIKRVNDSSELAIRMPTVSTAYKLYVDGVLLSTNGRVSEYENDFKPEYEPKVVTFKPNADEFDIILQVSNYVYARGGMWYPLYMGTSSSIHDHDQIIQVKDLLLVGAFLMFAVYHIFMYILRRNEMSNLTLVFLSLCAMGRVMIYGDEFKY